MFNWLRERFKTRTYINPGSWLTPPAQSGVQVTPDTSLTYSAVWAAINTIATDIGSLPCVTYRYSPAGGKTPDRDHPVYDLLYFEPNGDVDAFHFAQTMTAHCLTYGNAYAEIARDRDGYPKALYILDPRLTEPIRDRDHNLLYRLDERRTVLPEKVLHFKGLSYDGVKGYSPIEKARQSIGLGLGAELFGASFFGNSCTTSGWIKPATAMQPDQVVQLRESVENVHAGVTNANKIGVLPPGAEWLQATFTPEQSQFLESRQWQVIEVCRWFNLSPIRLQDYSHATYSNVEQAAIDHVTRTLRPWAENFENELNRKLLSREERKRWVIKHDLNAMLRGDLAAESTFCNAMSQIGVLNRNEVRERIGYNPIPDGDLFLVNGTFKTVEDAEAEQPDDQPVEEGTQDGVQDAQEDPVEDSSRAVPTAYVDAVRAIVLDAVTRMVRLEINAVRRAYRKDSPSDHLAEFYGKHAGNLRDAIAPGVHAFGAVLGRAIDPDEVADRMVRQSRTTLGDLDPEQVETLLGEWERRRAAEVVDQLVEEGT